MVPRPGSLLRLLSGEGPFLGSVFGRHVPLPAGAQLLTGSEEDPNLNEMGEKEEKTKQELLSRSWFIQKRTRF